MKKSSPKRDPLEEKNDTAAVERFEIVPGKTKDRRPRPKREGCLGGGLAGGVAGGLAGGGLTSLQSEKAFMKAVLAGDAATFLAGKTATALAGGAVTSLAGIPGTSLLILTKKDVPKGTVIKKTDLEAYVVSEPVTGLDKSIIKENPLGKVAKINFPAYSLIASVGLFGNPATPVTDIKLPPGGTLVIKAKKPIQKGTVIQEADLEVSVISSPIVSRDMYLSKGELVGKVATETIKEDRIIRKPMVK